MGIYGALQTAVTGMAAQSFALENISGNIANSQTTGYKRMETGFIDLIPDAAVGRQSPGAVLGYSRSTNDVRGDIVTSPTGTHVALNGGGFFVVAEKTGVSDGNAVFSDAEYYTRRGDFELDQNGYLRNGAGYYLKGTSINPLTNNPTSTVPEQVIRVENKQIEPQVTQRIGYQLNLPSNPSVGLAGTSAQIASSGVALEGVNAIGTAGNFSVTVGGSPMELQVDADTTVKDIVDWVNDNVAGASAEIDEDGNLLITANRVDRGIAVGGTAGILTALGISETSKPVPGAPETQSDFVAKSIEGGAITAYSRDGAAVSVEMRWAKLSNEPDTWQLYYLANGSPETWSKAPDGEFTFRDGKLHMQGTRTVAPDERLRLDLPGFTVGGTRVGDVEIDFGVGGLTQFANANGKASVSALNQDGFPSGEFMSVAINDSGRVVASYSNGKQIELYQLVTANFNAENQLKRLDGGVYSMTAESGGALYSSEPGVQGGALETSNTDISEEFTKLIVTQQAYAAGTRIVSTSDKMLQEALNMIR